MLRSLRCCLNPKVIGTLAVVGLAVWLFAPAAGAAALPVLIVMVCPLSMVAMAWGMRRRGSRVGPPKGATSPQPTGPTDVDAELLALREELAIARARRQLASHRGHPLP